MCTTLSLPVSHQQSSAVPLFLVEHYREQETSSHFTPAARLIISSELKHSGLLQALSDEAARSLLAVLAFVTPNGQIRPSASQVADVLGVPAAAAERRLQKLSTQIWRGEPLLRQHASESGLEVFLPSHTLVGEHDAAADRVPVVNLPIPSFREAIIAHSREAHARPRAEAERQVAEQLGHAPEEQADTPEGETRRRLVSLGVPRVDIDRLIASHPLNAINQQLDWLPHRNAKSPARFVVAAIERGYEPPPYLVRQAEGESVLAEGGDE